MRSKQNGYQKYQFEQMREKKHEKYMKVSKCKKPHRQSRSLRGKKTLSQRLEYIFKQNSSYDTDDSFAKHLQHHQNAAHLGEGVSVWPVADHLLRDVGVVEKTRLQR